MKWMKPVLFTVATLVLISCGANETKVECNVGPDCQGDPGAGCEWMCLDQRCEKVCPNDCLIAADCQSFPWESQCIGHWECIGGRCEPVCDPTSCAEVADCLGFTPPIGCRGHWECAQGECLWVCDEFPCTIAQDCTGLPWPVGCMGHWECTNGYCDALCDSTTCTTATDCEHLQLPCDQGHWTCEGGACLPVCNWQCSLVADCLAEPWIVKCLGHWACEGKVCTEVCDAIGCGDGYCDAAGGETTGSCPSDCPGSCKEALDCEQWLWPFTCKGHWECQRGLCIPVCDPEVKCLAPLDCLGLSWLVDCQGHWVCELENCREECDTVGCGNGYCDPPGGESAESCPPDCTIECQAPVDCLGHAWMVFCQGHWECKLGQCEALCEMVSCSDGHCDPAGGETAISCPSDCNPSCLLPVDCLGLPWEVGCPGHFSCEKGLCVPVCDAVGCGDGVCRPELGESPESCPKDCAVDCVGEGLPAGVPPDCCPGLDALNDCAPTQPCEISLLYCVDCGNGSCGPHENPYNCLNDCPSSCKLGERYEYTCPDGSQVGWCACLGPECQPVCLYLGSKSEGWYDSCLGKLLGWAQCDGHQAVCLHIGSRSEGWYDGNNGELIAWDYCAPLWDCLVDPRAACP